MNKVPNQQSNQHSKISETNPSIMSFASAYSDFDDNEKHEQSVTMITTLAVQNEQVTAINDDSSPKENFEDLTMHLNAQQNSKLICSFLNVEDKGEKKDYIGTYKTYEISLITEKSEKRILCQRRYDNFDSFYNKLKKKYPFLIFPKLPEKNMITKIINDEDFFSRRKRRLHFFLNFLYTHIILKDSREFLKFINDPEFDEDYFKKDVLIYSFPESEKISDSISKKIYGLFSNVSVYFSSPQGAIAKTDSEVQLRKMEEFYKSISEKMKEMKTNLETFILTIKKTNQNLVQASSQFFYLKDVVFESLNSKDFYLKFYQISGELSLICKGIYQKEGITLIDRFDSFLSIMNGICEAFDRYSDFMKIYHLVHKANEDAKVNRDSYNMGMLLQELKEVKANKSDFERILNEEIKYVVKRYQNEYLEILQDYQDLIQMLNNQEQSSLKSMANYFK